MFDLNITLTSHTLQINSPNPKCIVLLFVMMDFIVSHNSSSIFLVYFKKALTISLFLHKLFHFYVATLVHYVPHEYMLKMAKKVTSSSLSKMVQLHNQIKVPHRALYCHEMK